MTVKWVLARTAQAAKNNFKRNTPTNVFERIEKMGKRKRGMNSYMIHYHSHRRR